MNHETSAADVSRRPVIKPDPKDKFQLEQRLLSIVFAFGYPFAMGYSALEHYRKGGSITTGEALAAGLGSVYFAPCLLISAFLPERFRLGLLRKCDDVLTRTATYFDGIVE